VVVRVVPVLRARVAAARLGAGSEEGASSRTGSTAMATGAATTGGIGTGMGRCEGGGAASGSLVIRRFRNPYATALVELGQDLEQEVALVVWRQRRDGVLDALSRSHTLGG